MQWSPGSGGGRGVSAWRRLRMETACPVCVWCVGEEIRFESMICFSYSKQCNLPESRTKMKSMLLLAHFQCARLLAGVFLSSFDRPCCTRLFPPPSGTTHQPHQTASLSRLSGVLLSISPALALCMYIHMCSTLSLQRVSKRPGHQG